MTAFEKIIDSIVILSEMTTDSLNIPTFLCEIFKPYIRLAGALDKTPEREKKKRINSVQGQIGLKIFKVL
jgi:hypothetical protein